MLVVMHYSCGVNSSSPEDNPVGFIVVQPGRKMSAEFDCWSNEAKGLTEFAEFVEQHRDATWLGWRCLRRDYGLSHLAARWSRLTGRQLAMPGTVIDLKDQLKDDYGEWFAPHPRLESAAELNGVTRTGLLTAEQAADAFARRDFAALKANTRRRVAMIQSLHRLAKQGKFRAADDLPQVSGFLSAPNLCKAYGIPRARTAAFRKALERERERQQLSLDDWNEDENPAKNAPKFAYRADSAAVRAIIRRYR